MLRKKQFIRLFGLLIFGFLPKANGQFSGSVLSKSDNKPIEYATLFFKKSKVGVHTNEVGYFDVKNPIYPIDTLIISRLGFKHLIIPIKETPETMVFYLEESETKLESIEINRKRKTSLEWIGGEEKHKGFIFGQMGGTVLREVALFIPNESQKEGFLAEAGFYVVRFGKTKTPFRVKVYEPDANNMPGKELLTANVIIHGNWPNKYVTVNLNKMNIPFGKKGVFVAMEWLNLSEKKYFYGVKYPNNKTQRTFYGQQIGMSDDFEDLYGRVRINNGPWQVMNSLMSSPMFKAKIEFYDE